MVDRWVMQHQQDAWRKQAKASGYRARSAFKLKQIQERHKLIEYGDRILDVGCHPGGWSQVSVELVGKHGKVVGVDLQSCIPVEGATLIIGDITDIFTQNVVLEAIDSEKIDVVVSDISPDITGKWDIDQAVSLELVAAVFDFALPILRKGGHFVTKLFQGVGVEELIDLVKPHFMTVKRFSPTASRNTSSEVFLVCKHHKPKKGPDWKISPQFEKALEERKGGMDPLDDVAPVKSTFSVRKKSTPKE
ncbi:MAG TPA: RlmE family RNA methyltransferase [Candidatus Poseidoniales archaeon]|jgi:23S rRNA (uridine2552-2'-O)-methyltransferase|nr:MAG: 23S rRNA (uridine(2552)-2'-O)-methyltransferase [Euryarchaeota archaeon]HIF45382.1 RlmE family RNA methyltransferase [Candidatus Poseidoniales archaeon]HIL65030.1 RlmE family RNA methyltransferase [Candidatus Poseidoniales archaeon]